MAATTKIYVYDNFTCSESVLLGVLYVDMIRGGESYAFEYDAAWIANTKLSVSLDPEIALYPGRQYSAGKTIFGMFADASPDRWGRVLMNRRERILADHDGRRPRKLYDSDYLLGVDDKTRMGGLRFRLDPAGPFVSDDGTHPVPPWTRLRSLEEASRNYENDVSGKDAQWVRQLISPGSSLGGARPKATVADEHGNLWIAKFPSKHDENDIGAWEMVTHDLAALCGLRVPQARMERFSRFGSTYLARRFDRQGDQRVHYASAMTLLGKTDGASAADGTGYLDIAAHIKASGANPKADLEELWKRIVFSMAVNNTDDHLRNHAFLLSPHGWILSPMYDVNPVPYGDELALNVDATDNRISPELAIETAPHYEISKTRAKSLADEILETVRLNWKQTAVKYGLSHGQIEAMSPAFEGARHV